MQNIGSTFSLILIPIKQFSNKKFSKLELSDRYSWKVVKRKYKEKKKDEKCSHGQKVVETIDINNQRFISSLTKF